MLKQPASASRQLGRYLSAAPLAVLLTLGYSAAQAQVVPTPAPAQKPILENTAYYLDGKPIAKADFDKVQPDEIGSIAVRKGKNQLQPLGLGAATPDGAVLVTTKAKADSPEVVAFNRQFALTPATPAQEAAIAAARAYVAKHYPQAELESTFVVPGQPDRYRAIFKESGQRRQLLFDGQGQPVQE